MINTTLNQSIFGYNITVKLKDCILLKSLRKIEPLLLKRSELMQLHNITYNNFSYYPANYDSFSEKALNDIVKIETRLKNIRKKIDFSISCEDTTKLCNVDMIVDSKLLDLSVQSHYDFFHNHIIFIGVDLGENIKKEVLKELYLFLTSPNLSTIP